MTNADASTTNTEAAGSDANASPKPTRHFIQQILDEHIELGKWGEPGDRAIVQTRFPPEPNGYLHIGHAKALTTNFGLAAEFRGEGNGGTNLRFDDTNPEAEEQEYVDSIQRDIRWLGYVWDEPVRFASDYFETMYEYAVDLIEAGKAFVCEMSADEMRDSRGKPGTPMTASPWRGRPATESIDLLGKMRRGEVPTGSMTLRAKVDLASNNMNMRDPVMYRMIDTPHHRTGTSWKIYPAYDWAHGLEDSIEGITHSLCSLEFENHRPLYNWFIDEINAARASAGKSSIHHAQQIEFARLNPTYIVTSKRKLKQLVDENYVSGWDDPRMPTLSGLRRRGFTPDSIKSFCIGVGVTKFAGTHDITLLENAVRDDLNKRAPRRMAVLDPIKLTITNWGEHGDEGRLEAMDVVNNPEDPTAGVRNVHFGKSLYIERSDFMEDPPSPKKWFRLGPDREVRLRSGYWVRCHDFVKDANGKVTELLCTYDPTTRGGESPPPDAEGKVRKVRGTLHWVCVDDCIDAEVRVFDRLYSVEKPGKKSGNHLDDLNPESLTVITGAKVERPLASVTEDEPAWTDGIRRFQFERTGYFCVDSDSTAEKLVFNRTVSLKDSWAKAQKKG